VTPPATGWSGGLTVASDSASCRPGIGPRQHEAQALAEHALKVGQMRIGRDETNALTELGWSFLEGFIADADAFIFSRKEYIPHWVPTDKALVIPPSIDPFSAKNIELTEGQVRNALAQAGLVGNHPDPETVERATGEGNVVERNL
jgi:trehalose synthase